MDVFCLLCRILRLFILLNSDRETGGASKQLVHFDRLTAVRFVGLEVTTQGIEEPGVFPPLTRLLTTWVLST